MSAEARARMIEANRRMATEPLTFSREDSAPAEPTEPDRVYREDGVGAARARMIEFHARVCREPFTWKG